MYEPVMSALDDLDISQAAEAMVALRAAQLRADADRVALAAHWADLHGWVPDDTSRKGRPDEFAADHLGVLLGVATMTAEHEMTDAISLRQCHPLLWRRLMSGKVEKWKAVKVTRRCRAADLSYAQTRFVDQETAAAISSLPWGRFETLLDAKLIEADPQAADARRQVEETRRYVATGRSNAHGLKTLIAKAHAGDVIAFDATVDRLAAKLLEHGDTAALQVRRSKALGILANPVRTLLLLAEGDGAIVEAEAPAIVRSTGPALDEDGSAYIVGPRWRETIPLPPEPVDSADYGTPSRFAVPDELAEILARIEPMDLLPRNTLYVHVHAGALREGHGVARVEGIDPIVLDQVRELLADSHVMVKPVIDLADAAPVDCWEIPAKHKEILRLREPFECFPWGSSPTRRTDADHTAPYRPIEQGGPPGQTHPDKLGPLGRHHHRLKTHAIGWRVSQPAPGEYHWRTPTGQWVVVDVRGTHPAPSDSVMERHVHALVDSHVPLEPDG